MTPTEQQPLPSATANNEPSEVESTKSTRSLLEMKVPIVNSSMRSKLKGHRIPAVKFFPETRKAQSSFVQTTINYKRKQAPRQRNIISYGIEESNSRFGQRT